MSELEQEARGMRAEEQWLRYDTICIGEGAKSMDNGWFDTWEQFAKSSKIVWGVDRKDAGDSYSNLSGPQEDFAQVIYQSGVDFLAPQGIAGVEKQLLDAVMPAIFMKELPNQMAFHVQQANTDDVLVAPGAHLPGVTGLSGQTLNGAGSLILDGGQTGTADIRNSWQWPSPLQVPAKSKLQVISRVDGQMRDFLLQLDVSPGFKNIPFIAGNNEIEFAQLFNWYKIRVWHRGPRFVQMRGARSA